MLSPADVAVGQAMADVATIGLLHERSLHEQTLLSEQLQVALDARAVVEQATGVLSARGGIPVEQAFQDLRRSARERRLSLTAVAEEILADLATSAAERPGSHHPDHERQAADHLTRGVVQLHDVERVQAPDLLVGGHRERDGAVALLGGLQAGADLAEPPARPRA